MAMSLMVNNGIYQKVERDIKTSTAFRVLFEGFWTPELLRPNKPLDIDHNMPSFIVLSLGLISSTFIFCWEVFLGKKKRANPIVRSQPRPVTVSQSDVSDSERVDGVQRKGNICLTTVKRFACCAKFGSQNF